MTALLPAPPAGADDAAAAAAAAARRRLCVPRAIIAGGGACWDDDEEDEEEEEEKKEEGGAFTGSFGGHVPVSCTAKGRFLPTSDPPGAPPPSTPGCTAGCLSSSEARWRASAAWRWRSRTRAVRRQGSQSCVAFSKEKNAATLWLKRISARRCKEIERTADLEAVRVTLTCSQSSTGWARPKSTRRPRPDATWKRKFRGLTSL